MLRGAIVGTCEDMCPHAEIVARNNTQDVPIFERPNPRIAATTTELAVKRFARNVSQATVFSGLHSMPQVLMPRTSALLLRLMMSPSCQDNPQRDIHCRA